MGACMQFWALCALIVALTANLASAAANKAALRGVQPDRPDYDSYRADQTAKAEEKAEKAADEKKHAVLNRVLDLLANLEDKIQEEGEAEAQTYNKFACWCKDTQEKKTKSIQKEDDDVTELTATIGQLESDRDTLDDKIKDITEDIKDNKEEQATRTDTRKKAMKLYEANSADLNSAIGGLEGAIKAMKASKKPSFLQEDVASTVRTAITLADALGIGGSVTGKAMAFIQAPGVPTQSDEIIETLEKLLDDFRKKKVKVDETEVADAKDHDSAMMELARLYEALSQSLEDAKKKRAKKVEEIENSNKQYTTTSHDRLDDQETLTEVAQTCSDKAKTWNQRSEARANELQTITALRERLTEKVSAKLKKGTVRLTQQATSLGLAKFVAQDDASMEALEASVEAAEESPLSFMQRSTAGNSTSDEKAKEKIMSMLRTKGGAIKSLVLTSLAGRLADDPLAKVKLLIQELIDRLLQEAAGEADHAAWCEKSTTNAEQKRDYAAKEIREINGRMALLEANRDKLAQSMIELTKEIGELQTEGDNATTLREADKAENNETITTAEEGKEAIEMVIEQAKTFYAQMKKNTVDLEASGEDAEEVGLLRRAKPIKAAPDAGFETGEAYTGAQSESGGIIAMFEVMQSDFERTIKEVSKEERLAETDHMKLMTRIGTSIAEKQSAFDESKSQKEAAVAKLDDAEESLGEMMDLLTGKISELLELKPACVDTGMSYKERAARRKQEMDALENALCILKAYEEYGPDGLANAC